MKEILTKVFGGLKPCQMDFYSEVVGEVFQSAPQSCGPLTYFYIFMVEEDDDEPTAHCFSVDLWYEMSGHLMSPRLNTLRGEFKTEEDARYVKAQVETWSLIK